jgi:hypothetical protein
LNVTRDQRDEDEIDESPLRDDFTGGGLAADLKDADQVRIVALGNFIAPANDGRL